MKLASVLLWFTGSKCDTIRVSYVQLRVQLNRFSCLVSDEFMDLVVTHKLVKRSIIVFYLLPSYIARYVMMYQIWFIKKQLELVTEQIGFISCWNKALREAKYNKIECMMTHSTGLSISQLLDYRPFLAKNARPCGDKWYSATCFPTMEDALFGRWVINPRSINAIKWPVAQCFRTNKDGYEIDISSYIPSV